MTARAAAGVAAALLGAALCTFIANCSPEELVFAPSGGDASLDGVAGSGGASGSGGTGVDAGGWIEVCGNGVDDDQDGLTDCEDPACDEHACVPAAPTGWTGPGAAYVGAASTLPECPEGLEMVYEGSQDLRFDKATCTGCTCGSPQNEQCSVTVGVSTAGTCATFADSVTLSSTTCNSTGQSLVTNIQVTSKSGSATCAPGPQPTVVTTPATWDAAVRVCAAQTQGAGVGCEAGSVCAPASATADPCVLRAGEHSCPPEYPRRRLYFAGTNDTRDCGDCGCSLVGGGSCSATVTAYASAGCSSPTGSTSGTTCVGVSEAQSVRLSGISVSGSCSSSGASATGCVLPTSPTTVCCAGSGGPSCPVGKGPDMIEVPEPGGGSYCIDSTEVTNTQYEQFLASNPSVASQPADCAWNTSFVPSSTWPDTDVNEPVNYVDWCDAAAFCAWAGKRLCGSIGGGTLPSSSVTNENESQWFNACSAGGAFDYPYGAEAIPGACADGLTDVRSSPCCGGGYSGLYDLVGNVREWIDSCSPPSGPQGPDKAKCHAVGVTSCTSADTPNRSDSSLEIGFRCCAP